MFEVKESSIKAYKKLLDLLKTIATFPDVQNIYIFRSGFSKSSDSFVSFSVEFTQDVVNFDRAKGVIARINENSELLHPLYDFGSNCSDEGKEQYYLTVNTNILFKSEEIEKNSFIQDQVANFLVFPPEGRIQ